MFTEISGAIPAQINVQPPLQIHQEAGDLAEASLSVSQQPGRIDVILSDQPTRNTTNPEGPNYKPLFWIGPFDASLEKFDKLTSKVVSLVNSATRAAYSIVLVRQATSTREAMLVLRGCLPTVEFDADHDGDLSFQINRRARGPFGLVNRLAKWDLVQGITFQLAIGGPPAPQVPLTPPIFAARVYIDVSTDAENQAPFGSDVLPRLVDALRAYAVEIAERGDKA